LATRRKAVQRLLQKLKIEEAQKSRENRFLERSCCRKALWRQYEGRRSFWHEMMWSPRRGAQNASAVFRIFVLHPKKTFATISAKNGPGLYSRKPGLPHADAAAFLAAFQPMIYMALRRRL
jgi:hypothetical protein